MGLINKPFDVLLVWLKILESTVHYCDKGSLISQLSSCPVTLYLYMGVPYPG